MRKSRVIDVIIEWLSGELESLGEEGRFSGRAAEIERQLLMYRFLPRRDFDGEDCVCPAALVELELNGIRSHYLVVPGGGGLVTSVDGKPVQVVTPQSPVASAMMGRKAGETFRVTVASGERVYRILGIR